MDGSHGRSQTRGGNLKQENKNSTKKVIKKKRQVFSFFLEFLFSLSLSWSSSCFHSCFLERFLGRVLVFLNAFLVEFYFSCFLTFLFSFINSYLWDKATTHILKAHRSKRTFSFSNLMASWAAFRLMSLIPALNSSSCSSATRLYTDLKRHNQEKQKLNFQMLSILHSYQKFKETYVYSCFMKICHHYYLLFLHLS